MKVELVAELTGHSGPVYSLSTVGDVLFTTSSDRMLGSWDLKTNAPSKFSVKSDHGIYCHLKHKQFLLIGNSSGHVNILDLDKKTEVKNYEIHSKGVFSIVYWQKANLLVSAGGAGVLNFLDPTTLDIVRSIKINDVKIRSLLPVKERLYVGHSDGMIRTFESEYLNEVSSLDSTGESVNALAYHSEKDLLISGGKEGVVKFWKSNNEIFSAQCHLMTIYSIQFSPCNTYVVTASRDKSVKVWNASDWELMCKLDRKSHRGHTHSVNASLWLNDSEFLTAGDDRVIKRWRIVR